MFTRCLCDVVLEQTPSHDRHRGHQAQRLWRDRTPCRVSSAFAQVPTARVNLTVRHCGTYKKVRWWDNSPSQTPPMHLLFWRTSLHRAHLACTCFVTSTLACSHSLKITIYRHY